MAVEDCFDDFDVRVCFVGSTSFHEHLRFSWDDVDNVLVVSS